MNFVLAPRAKLARPSLAKATANPRGTTAHIEDGNHPNAHRREVVIDREGEAGTEQAKVTIDASMDSRMEPERSKVPEHALEEIVPDPIFLGILEGTALLEVIDGLGREMDLAQAHHRSRRARTSERDWNTALPARSFRCRSASRVRCQAGEARGRSPPCSEAQRDSIAASRSGRLIFSISVGVIG